MGGPSLASIPPSLATMDIHIMHISISEIFFRDMNMMTNKKGNRKNVFIAVNTSYWILFLVRFSFLIGEMMIPVG